MEEGVHNHREVPDDLPEVEEPWHHPGQPTVDEVPPEVEQRRRDAARRQQRMTEDKTGKAE